MPLKDDTRHLIRQLYFVDHLPLDVIAAELRLTRTSVRRALVLRGGAASPRRRRRSGPYLKETPS